MTHIHVSHHTHTLVLTHTYAHTHTHAHTNTYTHTRICVQLKSLRDYLCCLLFSDTISMHTQVNSWTWSKHRYFVTKSCSNSNKCEFLSVVSASRWCLYALSHICAGTICASLSASCYSICYQDSLYSYQDSKKIDCTPNISRMRG